MNHKQHLKDGMTMRGSWLQLGCPAIAEIMAPEFDWLCVDLEHGDPAVDVHAMFRAIRAGNPDCAPFVRLHKADHGQASKYMDAGAAGIIGAMVNTAEEANNLAGSCIYPTNGWRGLGFCRANEWGATMTPTDSAIIVVQIETYEGWGNLEEILSVPNIDAAMIGPWDLALSMRCERYKINVQRFLDRCPDIAAGIHVTDPDPAMAEQYIKNGFRLVARGTDTEFIKHGMRS